MARQIGLTTNTPTRLQLGAGKLIKSYGGGNARSLGATRGGATFTITPEFRDVPVDGALGSVKSLKRLISVNVELTATLLEFSEDNFLAFMQATTKTADTPTGWDTFKRNSDIADSDYIDNVALVVEQASLTNPAVYMAKNVLNTAPFAPTTENNGEVTLAVTFMAHYDLSAPTDEPWEIRLPKT